MNSSGYGSAGRPTSAPRLRTFIGLWRLARPRQWVKNTFVFAPLFFTPSAVSWKSLAIVLSVFVGFCMISSAVYCFNDFRDREADRKHPDKMHRPLAAGMVGVATALVFALVLALAGLAIIVLAAPDAVFYVLLYVGANVAYSMVLKRYPIIDVLTISMGFVLRIYAGAAALDITPTVWIQICAGLLALFIALAKRRDDLVKDLGADHRESLSGYSKPFLDTCVVVTLAVLLVSYLIFTADSQAMERLGSDKLFLTTPYVIAGLFRYLQLTLVYERSGSPTDLLFNDRFLMASVAAWLASFAYLIYV
jgi:4-hydroxybenzoate polyprenyltransferase